MRIKIPATSANLGPGFDCIGMALSLYNEIAFEPVEQEGYFELSASGEGVDDVSLGADNLIYQAYSQTFAYANRPVRGVKMHFDNQIPFARGLGSSSAAIIGGIMVANKMMDDCLTEHEMLKIALAFEGHPDNIAPALMGGIVLCGLNQGEVFYQKITPPKNLHCYVVIPDYPLATIKARAVLPMEVPRGDAIFNVARMGLLIDALHTGNLQQLSLAMQDKLHQPYRQELIVGMAEITQAATAAGACAVVISGAGPTLLILSDHEADFSVVLSILQAKGVTGRVEKLQPVDMGAMLV